MWTVDALNFIFSFWVKPIIIFSSLGLYVHARVDKSSSTCHWVLSLFGFIGICVLIVGWFLPITLNLAIVPHAFLHWLNVNIYMYSQKSEMFLLLWIIGVYVFFALFLINLRIYDLYVTWCLVKDAKTLRDADFDRILCASKVKMYVKKYIPIYVSGSSITPMVWGVFNPCIVLPSNYVTWDNGRAKRIVAHELAHIKRNDWLIKQLVFVFSCCFWFVPGARSWEKRINWYAELACDDAVIRAYDCRAEYATDLMALGTTMRLNQAFLGFAETQTLAARIRHVLESGREREPLTTIFKFGLFFVFMVFFVLFSLVRFSPMSWFYSDEFIMSHSTTLNREVDIKKIDGSEDLRSHSVLEEKVHVESNRLITMRSPYFSASVVRPSLDKGMNNQEELMHIIAYRKLATIDDEYAEVNKLALIKTPEISMAGYVGQHIVSPVYPHSALRRDIEGKVVALFDIDEHGRVKNIRLTNAYPKRIFNDAVISALQKSVYEPTRIYDYAVTTKNVKETFLFKIRYATHITND